ncbi:hypothetical protein [Micromonospora sediminicola]|uniref:hypothetical protein n=1 Tax=Micromonospora sediminicola TaxID=946078 RepID=UPI001FE1B704|nr:hypothetical protein [Micromonospora sediminicola]
MTPTNKPAGVTDHPDWCAPDRCGRLVPPLMTEMTRHHRGAMHRVGNARAGGMVVAYLIGVDVRTPLIAVHASCRAGVGWAELSLTQAAELIERLSGLVVEAGGDLGSHDD